MIKKVLFSAIFIIMAMSSASFAAGIGVYGTGAVARDTWSPGSGKTNDYYYGGGLIIESVSAKDKLFGYRFKLDYQQLILKDPDYGGMSDPIHFVNSSHTFGFGVYRSKKIRFWVGPQIGLGYYFGSQTNSYVDPFLLIQIRETVNYSLVGVEVLAAAGVNFNVGQKGTIFVDFAFGYMGKWDTTSSLEAHGIGAKLSFGFMYRINDTYKAAEQ